MANNTMRKAYLKWQALETSLGAAREELSHQYLALLHKAEALQLDTRHGLLHSASGLLNQPLDPQTLQLQQRLKNAFAILGKGFFRRSPTSLPLDIMKYAERLKEVCQRCHYLGVRLRLTRKVLDSLHRHSDWNTPQSFHLALSHPEAIWMSLLLRQKRLLIRQIINFSLAGSWQTKLTVCQSWLELLESSLPPKTRRDLQKKLAELAEQTAGQPGQTPFGSTGDHRQLDLISSLANQQASEIIASSLNFP